MYLRQDKRAGRRAAVLFTLRLQGRCAATTLASRLILLRLGRYLELCEWRLRSSYKHAPRSPWHPLDSNVDQANARNGSPWPISLPKLARMWYARGTFHLVKRKGQLCDVCRRLRAQRPALSECKGNEKGVQQSFLIKPYAKGRVLWVSSLTFLVDRRNHVSGLWRRAHSGRRGQMTRRFSTSMRPLLSLG